MINSTLALNNLFILRLRDPNPFSIENLKIIFMVIENNKKIPAPFFNPYYLQETTVKKGVFNSLIFKPLLKEKNKEYNFSNTFSQDPI